MKLRKSPDYDYGMAMTPEDFFRLHREMCELWDALPDSDELVARYLRRDVDRANYIKDINSRFRFDLYHLFKDQLTPFSQEYTFYSLRAALRRIVPDISPQ